MRRQTRRTRPGDAANLVVRCLLADAGKLLGGLTEAQWEATLKYFGFRCAYTDEPLAKDVVKDHAIPINKDHCGLHLYGNVLPCTQMANVAKAGTHYREFVNDSIRLRRIEAFIEQTGYAKIVEAFGDLRSFCTHQYEVITGLCGRNREYVQRLIDPVSEHVLLKPEEDLGKLSGSASRSERQIILDPFPASAFKKSLLRKKRAWIMIYLLDGTREVKEWVAERFTDTSNVIGNLRSRPEFRPSEWQSRGIARVVVTIDKPEGARAIAED